MKRCSYGFSLRKQSNTYTFLTESEQEFNDWTMSLKPFVVQEDVWSEYSFSHLIGQGSYGKVFLATHLKSEQSAGPNELSDSRKDND